jgi:hypothetical protein
MATCMRFEVLTALIMKITVFLDVECHMGSRFQTPAASIFRISLPVHVSFFMRLTILHLILSTKVSGAISMGKPRLLAAQQQLTDPQ